MRVPLYTRQRNRYIPRRNAHYTLHFPLVYKRRNRYIPNLSAQSFEMFFFLCSIVYPSLFIYPSRGGLPMFLKNHFAGNARGNLLLALKVDIAKNKFLVFSYDIV